MNSSRHPIAITGSHASALSSSADKLTHKFLFMDYFNIGILIP
jgi:hypothetical protein